MDRFTGMIGIFLVALIMLPFCLRYMNAEDTLMTALIWLLIAGSVAGLAAAAVVIQHRKLEKLKIYRKIQALADRFSGGLFSRVADALDSYEHCRREIIICIIASMIFVNGVLWIAGFFIARGVDHSWIKAGATIEAVTLGNIAGLLPLTPSGVGARDFFVKNMLESAGM